MRRFVKAAFPAAALSGLILAAAANAQDTATPPAPSAAPPSSAAAPQPTGEANPRGPIPYTALHRPAAPKRVVVTPPKPITAVVPAAAAALAPPVLTAARPNARLSPGAPIPAGELEAYVDGVVQDAMAADHIAGVTVSVVQNGQVVLKKGYGFASQSPARAVDPDRSLFRLGSISKTFTWIALMKEVEAGRIRMEAPLNLYLPEALQVKDQGFKRPIQVRDLPTHSAGFEDRLMGQLFERDPSRVRPLAVYLRQERPRRVREAGSLPTYSNYGAALAGEAVSYVTNKPFESIIESEITGPLNMSRTTFREPYPRREGLPEPMAPALRPDIAQGFHWTGATFQPRDYEYISQIAPAGAVSSTAADMARYMLMILNGGSLDGATIYGPTTAQGFRTTLQRSAPGVDGWDDGFMEIPLAGGFKGQGHGGATLSFLSGMVVVPELNLGIFVSTNTDTGGQLTQRLPQAIVGRFYATPQDLASVGSPALAENARAYEGTYLTTRRAYHGLEKFISLFQGLAKVTVTPDGKLITDGDGQAQTWLFAGADEQYARFRQADGPQTLVFQMQDGRAVRWFSPSGTSAFERLGAWRQPPVMLLLALLTVIAAISTLAGLFSRGRRDARQTNVQARASLMQTSSAVLWLVCLGCFALWASETGDIAKLFYSWPGPLLLASASALVAALLTVVTIITLPAIWRGGRRLDSWTIGRKLRFSMTVLVFSAFAAVLFAWGALEPWG